MGHRQMFRRGRYQSMNLQFKSNPFVGKREYVAFFRENSKHYKFLTDIWTIGGIING